MARNRPDAPRGEDILHDLNQFKQNRNDIINQAVTGIGIGVVSSVFVGPYLSLLPAAPWVAAMGIVYGVNRAAKLLKPNPKTVIGNILAKYAYDASMFMTLTGSFAALALCEGSYIAAGCAAATALGAYDTNKKITESAQSLATLRDDKAYPIDPGSTIIDIDYEDVSDVPEQKPRPLGPRL